jgi:hypothetical protein
VATSWIVFGPEFGLAGGLLRALIVGLALAGREVMSLILGVWFTTWRTIHEDTSFLSPLTSWRSERKYDLTLGLLLALESAIVFGTLTAVVRGLSNGVYVALIIGVAGLGATGLNLALSSFAFVQLAMRWHTPVRLMRFLDDASRRGVLRRIGPLYQFRHARLQDYLARQGSSPP